MPEILLLAVEVADAVPDSCEVARGAGVAAQLLALLEACNCGLHVAHLHIDNALRVLSRGDVVLRGELVRKLDCPLAAPERGLRSELDHEGLLGVDAPEHVDELPGHVVALQGVDELHELLIAVGHVAAVSDDEIAELRLNPEPAAHRVHIAERKIRVPCGLGVVAPGSGGQNRPRPPRADRRRAPPVRRGAHALSSGCCFRSLSTPSLWSGVLFPPRRSTLAL